MRRFVEQDLRVMTMTSLSDAKAQSRPAERPSHLEYRQILTCKRDLRTLFVIAGRRRHRPLQCKICDRSGHGSARETTLPRRIRFVAVAVAVAALAAASLPLALPPADAAPNDRVFSPLRGFQPSGAKVRVDPQRYSAVRVHPTDVRAALRGAPPVGSSRSTVFELPTPTGDTERFAVQRSQVMQAKL